MVWDAGLTSEASAASSAAVGGGASSSGCPAVGGNVSVGAADAPAPAPAPEVDAPEVEALASFASGLLVPALPPLVSANARMLLGMWSPSAESPGGSAAGSPEPRMGSGWGDPGSAATTSVVGEVVESSSLGL